MQTPNFLLDQRCPRTLEVWVDEFSQPAWRGASVQAWLFEGLAARRAAERQLAAAGVQATVGIQIGIGHYQFLFQSDSTQEIQEEGFTGTVFAHHHPERRAAFG